MKKFFPVLIAFLCLVTLCACGGASSGAETAAVTPSPEPTATPEPTPEPTAEPTATPVPPAQELTDSLTVTDNWGSDTSALTDLDCLTGQNYTGGAVITVVSETPMQGAYFVWEQPPCAYTVCANGTGTEGGTFGCLHEYIPFETPATEFTLEISDFSMLRDIRAFSEGTLPEDLQLWEAPCDKADVCVFSTHADDDVIFFGALIADCVDRGLAVQVCYLTKHYSEQPRPHELLNALWAMGVHHYPIIGYFQDIFCDSLGKAVEAFGREEVVGYVVENLRRFKPSVAVGHDLQGEYGHGAHMLYSEALTIACNIAGDAQVYPRTAEQYGVWEVPKVYLHFYGDTPLMLEVEKPLETFGGKTAFEVASEAMQFHESQLKYAHRPQLESDQFPRYDCRCFGLYRSLVGEDTGSDIMEHIS